VFASLLVTLCAAQDAPAQWTPVLSYPPGPQQPAQIAMSGGVQAQAWVHINNQLCQFAEAPVGVPLVLASSCNLQQQGGGSCFLGAFPALSAVASCPVGGLGSGGSNIVGAHAEAGLGSEYVEAIATGNSLSVKGGLVGYVGSDASYHGRPCDPGHPSKWSQTGQGVSQLLSVPGRVITIPFTVNGNNRRFKGEVLLWMLWGNVGWGSSPSPADLVRVDCEIVGVGQVNCVLTATGATQATFQGALPPGSYQLKVTMSYDLQAGAAVDCMRPYAADGGVVNLGWSANLAFR